VDPPGGNSGLLDRRVLRGGPSTNIAYLLRSSFRDGLTPGSRYIINGFRVARTP
jgi:formylglycine-generating enzyme required for sulfatase activity